jgi:hypothetical protein
MTDSGFYSTNLNKMCALNKKRKTMHPKVKIVPRNTTF